MSNPDQSPATVAELIEALRQAEAGLEVAVAHKPQTTGFVPSHVLALQIVKGVLERLPTEAAAMAATVPAAEPMFWVRLRSDGGYEGPIHNDAIERVRKESGGWTPLYSHMAATEAIAPSGYALVPLVPTKEMKAAAVVFANGTAVYKNVAAGALEIEEDIYGEAYAAMLAAAPQAPVAGQPAEPSPADLWYLQDTRSYVGNDVLWWAKDGKGYTTDISKAHTFGREEAFRQAAMRGSDRAWPKAYIDGKTRPAVDMQYIDHEAALEFAPKGDSNG